MKRICKFCIILGLMLMTACTPKPQPINIGSDECAHCRMIISEAQFGSQIVSTTGKTWFFDSVECLAAFELTGSLEKDRIHSRWVPDFTEPQVWLQAEDAWILHSPQLRSPMGLNLSAFPDEPTFAQFKNDYQGEQLEWNQVKRLVDEAWMGGRNWNSFENGGR